MNTPWGQIQERRQLAGGIECVSTASHGGYHLSPQRAEELRRVLPTAKIFAGPCWLEEDCDWALAVLVWPDLFSDQDAYNAVRTIVGFHEEIDLFAYYGTERGEGVARRAAAYWDKVRDAWEVGSLCGPIDGAPKGSFGVSLLRGADERRFVCFRCYPERQFYKDAELVDIVLPGRMQGLKYIPPQVG